MPINLPDLSECGKLHLHGRSAPG